MPIFVNHCQFEYFFNHSEIRTMDVEATQAIDFAEYDDETDDEPVEENKKKPVTLFNHS